MITSETLPYIKSGGLADVVYSLSLELKKRGHDVRIVLPNYQSIEHTESCRQKHSCTIRWGISNSEPLRVLEENHDDIRWYFADNPLFSERGGIYGETSHTPYPDNLYRFTFFSRAALEICRMENWLPDVFHCHDWTAGFIPALLKETSREGFSNTAGILTIHNLGYQGTASRLDITSAGLPKEYLFNGKQPGQNDHINMLAAGIAHADRISTVSKKYAEEILTPEFGHGLDLLLRSKKEKLVGILNGADYEEWNPEQDKFIPQHYSAASADRKRVNKRELQKIFGLEIDDSVPVVGMISRIAEQKGFVELLQGTPCVLERLAEEFDVQFAVVGTGDRSLEERLTEAGNSHDNIAVKIMFENRLAHLVEAGADFFLMPSRYEPCGLNQIYSLKYGTLPIVHNTGGLADTVYDIDEAGSERGTGIVFSGLSPESIYNAVIRGIQLYAGRPEAYQQAVKNAMLLSFSWEEAAAEYEHMYEAAYMKGASYDE